jgi:hypothetical protein
MDFSMFDHERFRPRFAPIFGIFAVFMKRITLLLLAGSLALLTSWGFLVHRTVNQLAIYRLPPNMQLFFFNQKEYLVKQSVRPDLRRNQDSTEATKHFIDFEAYGDSAAWKMPMDWQKAVDLYSKDSLLKYGYVPYHVITMMEHLTQAFRKMEKDSILFYAADLSHYIADAHVPLHTTLNYDGQLTNQRGLHALWESVVPEVELVHYDLYVKGKAQYISDPALYVWEIVRESHQLLGGVFEEERLATLQFTDSTKYRRVKRNGREMKYYTDPFAKAYSSRLGNTINDQLKNTAAAISNCWYTCWVNAGKPDLDVFTSQEEAAKQNEQLREENKAFRANQLIEKGWLLSKKNAGSSE